jgi:hypothetical protein
MVTGYHQIDLNTADKKKPAYRTKQGRWAYSMAPFGLKTALAIFQSLKNSVSSGLTCFRCFRSLDYVVICAKFFMEHDEKLREVFSKLRKYNLKLQPDKLKFPRKEVNCLGHLTPTRPKNEKQLQSFPGMANNHRKFIARFTKYRHHYMLCLRKIPILNGQWNREILLKI